MITAASDESPPVRSFSEVLHAASRALPGAASTGLPGVDPPFLSGVGPLELPGLDPLELPALPRKPSRDFCSASTSRPVNASSNRYRTGLRTAARASAIL
eukprot:scaffold10_cov257-Pinguiococcus_pyrenoidosus.AAC.71